MCHISLLSSSGAQKKPRNWLALRAAPIAAESSAAVLNSILRYNFPMPRTAAKLLEEARQLPPDEQDWLAESLLIKEDPEAQLASAWDAEIKRRLDEIDSGAVKMIPLEEVLADMDAQIAGKRRG